MKIDIRMVTPLLLSAIAAVPTSAQAQRFRAGNTAQICLLDADGARQFELTMDSLLVQVLSGALPNRFAAVQDQEDCDDPRDNNCNGEVNEGCNEPTRWDSGADCDACMAQNCAEPTQACDAEEECDDVMACVVEQKCLDAANGSISCLCGLDVGVAQCQQVPELDQLDGPCAQEMVSYLRDTGRVQTGSVSQLINLPPPPATEILTCMVRECQSECTELVYNDDIVR